MINLKISTNQVGFDHLDPRKFVSLDSAIIRKEDYE
jgi:hypothetical protein